MSVKSEMAAMIYLSKVRPEKYFLSSYNGIYRLTELVPVKSRGKGYAVKIVEVHRLTLFKFNASLVLLQGGKSG